MTTDHTPAEAGTDLAVLAETVQDVQDDLFRVGGDKFVRRLAPVEAALRAHRCSPSVVPRGTFTEGGDMPVMWWSNTYGAVIHQGWRDRPYQVVRSTGLRDLAELPTDAIRLAPSVATAGTEGEAEGHRYLSTGCLHGEHGYCQSMTGQHGEKRPGKCKFCDAQCICACHAAASSRGEAQGQGEDDDLPRLRVDRQADAAYVDLTSDLTVDRTVQLGYGINVDLDDEDNVVGVELLSLTPRAAAPRAMAPVGNVDRDTLVQAIRDQAPDRAQVGGKTVTPEDAAAVALAALRNQEQS